MIKNKFVLFITLITLPLYAPRGGNKHLKRITSPKTQIHQTDSNNNHHQQENEITSTSLLEMQQKPFATQSCIERSHGTYGRLHEVVAQQLLEHSKHVATLRSEYSDIENTSKK